VEHVNIYVIDFIVKYFGEFLSIFYVLSDKVNSGDVGLAPPELSRLLAMTTAQD
jgi:hypothetical protein